MLELLISFLYVGLFSIGGGLCYFAAYSGADCRIARVAEL